MKKLYIIQLIIILIGSIICLTKGFNIELQYSSRDEFVIGFEKQTDISEIADIIYNSLSAKKIKLQKADRFGKSIQITASQISEDEKNDIINKINEKLGIEIDASKITIYHIANTRIRDILKPYILPAMIAFAISLLYLLIVYNKLGVKRVLSLGIILPIIEELTFYSIIGLTQIPFGTVVNSIAIGIFIITICVLSYIFNNEKEID